MKSIELIKLNKKINIITSGDDGGICYMKSVNDEVLTIIFSNGGGWDHVSISLKDRIPTWNEMCMIKDCFFDDNETVIQYHPKKSEYKNLHNNCLHLWKKQNNDFELPPKYMI